MPDAISFVAGTEEHREWCARVMASSEPWITLGRGIDRCRAICSDPDYLLSLCLLDGQPGGFVLLHRRGVAGSPYIASIAVAEEFRGQGVGARLLEFVEQQHREKARFMFLCVSSFNSRAKRFYERQGYTVVGELKDYIIEGQSEILMQKRLR